MSTPAPTTHAADPRTSAPTPNAPAPPPNLPFRGDPSEAGKRGPLDTQAGPTGRAVSARNATTHGLFARDVVLPALGEDPAAFDALLHQLCEQLPPRNLLERHYLEQIAAASWRLRRLHRWQAQVYEDETLTEDQRLDKLDKVLRHETTLTRQIDRAVRTLNRDLKWLFEGRARDEAFYQRDLTPNEVHQEPELEIEVQRDIWRRLRPTPPPDLGDARLDNTATLPPSAPRRDCENGPPAPPSPPDNLPPPDGPRQPRSHTDTGFPPLEGRDRRLAAEGEAAEADCKNCQNEPAPSPESLPWTGLRLPPRLRRWGPGGRLNHTKNAKTKLPARSASRKSFSGSTPTPPPSTGTLTRCSRPTVPPHPRFAQPESPPATSLSPILMGERCPKRAERGPSVPDEDGEGAVDILPGFAYNGAYAVRERGQSVPYLVRRITLISTLLKRALATVGLLAASAGATYAAGDAVPLPVFTSQVNSVLVFVLVASVAAILYGFTLRTQVLRLSPGTESMQRVGEAIRSGAYAYLQKQVRTMLPLVILLAVVLFFLFRSQAGYTTLTALGVSLAFLAGVTLSYAAGYIGMGMAVTGNQRTANQALTTYKGALETAFKSGAVAGMMTVGLGLLGATIIFLIFKSDAMKVLVGFGFGGSLAALFMRVGGGIFTKAADVGADLVGKVEQDIPEDDPRNAATIADNVGDNVGDCAGMAADVFESYLVTLVAAMILGAAVGGPAFALPLILFPLAIHGIGIIASIFGVFSMRGKEDLTLDPLKPINAGFWLTALLALIGVAASAGLPALLGQGVTVNGQHYETWRFVAAVAIGVVLALAIGKLTEYFTGSDARPVNEVAHASQTGPATLILTGFSLGLESAAWGAVAIVIALFAIVLLFGGNALLAAYGIALSGLGLLTTTGYVLAMDTFGPISDNANGIFEMSGALKEHEANLNGAGPHGLPGDKVVAKLDSAGNTTKALTKGFAIATAVIAAVALFRTFMTDAHLSAAAFSLGNPRVFIGLLIGGAAPYLFCSFAINAVSRAAFQLVEEVRRQFREMPGIMAGTQTPDYARCVDIATAAAQRELLGPGILAICLPILVGFGLGPASLGGYLAGAIVSGQLMAVLLANSGGAWDNAKKKVEDGLFGGKGTEQHKAAVIGDTVGDPFKDTAGPALNPLIKVMNLVGVLIAGVITLDIPATVTAAIVILMALLLTGAILFSKRGGPQLTAGGAAGGDTPLAASRPDEVVRK